MFSWKKIGKIFDPLSMSPHDWMQEQAQNPYSVEFKKFLRVYFNCRPKRDAEGKSTSFAGYVDLDKKNLLNILDISRKPLLPLGKIGEFDEFGIMAGSVKFINDAYYLYYVGWTRMKSVPYNWAIGLATSSDNGRTFSRYGRGPIIGATAQEPYLQAGCSSIINVGDQWHLWYTSGIKWLNTSSKPESVYRIMHAVSSDGIEWQRDGKPIIAPVLEDEAQASPSIIQLNNRWHLFFSYRYSENFRNKDRGYRLGYAWSDDLRSWNRDDSLVGMN